MRIVIDHDLCTGHGRCFDLAPELFEDDEDGYGQVRDDMALTADLEPAARKALLSCPERAISVEG